jgi:Tol biopolymer transport system component
MAADGTADRKLVNFNGSGIAPESLSTESFDWSPSGAQLTFDRCDSRGCDIFTVKSDGTALTRITHTGGVNRFASWSP